MFLIDIQYIVHCKNFITKAKTREKLKVNLSNLISTQYTE